MNDAGAAPLSRPPGLAGTIAAAFIGSKLTPLVVIASILLGLLAVWRLPREEEPQIVVPMVDVFAALPGASPAEVEERLAKPLERLLREVPGVEYVYSTSSPGQALVVVRFLVGEDAERATVRLNDRLRAHPDLLPAGAGPPLVRPRSIDDVPVLVLTLWSERYDEAVLRRVALEVAGEVKQVADVSEVALIGGRRRVVTAWLDPERMAASNLTAEALAAALAGANLRLPAGGIARGNREVLLEAGGELADVAAVRRVVVAVREGRPLRLDEVARVEDGGEEPAQHASIVAGAAATGIEAEHAAEVRPAVTLTVAKRRGTNAIAVVRAVRAKVAALAGSILPEDLHVTITRDYGETANEKSNELLEHMGIAVLGVAALIALVLGRREALVVLLAIPTTLALTLAVFWLLGYTLNRITLFALIFSIGILVDDAIVVLENIARHRRLEPARGQGEASVVVQAVAEVGNPTILATLAVVAAILPMAFVGGLMGPYMRPIPVGSTAAMLFSLLVAFVVTPWAALRLLGRGGASHGAGEGASTRLYRRVMGTLVRKRGPRAVFLAAVVLLLLASAALVPLGLVQVKMLPFDDKSEFQVIVNAPEGTTLERTAAVAKALADIVREEPEVRDVETYVGTAGPYNFSGLVRHYFLRHGANRADLQVNLAGKGERSLQSHEIAKRTRTRLEPIARRLGVRVQVAEVPPGPPVLATLVAEIYGPDRARLVEIAAAVRRMLESTPGVVDVDWYVEEEQPKLEIVVDQERAALSGVSPAEVARTLALAVDGEEVGRLHDPRAGEPVPIVLRLDRGARSDLDRLLGLRVGRGPSAVGVGDVARAVPVAEAQSRYRKNLLPVVYVTADVAGSVESPVYAVLALSPRIAGWTLPEGYAMEQYTAAQPLLVDRYALKWDGEWHITYEVFRDLGAAFAVVLVLIYILVVAWFQDFKVPLVIMSAIPFSLVGILSAHALLGAFFTATSMIGFIAGAGIVVRNSIILVDFIELRRAQGMPLEDAVVDAGAVRFRPMLLTAAAVVVGAAVILFDPIFQGLAISLMAGEIASLLLSRMTVPVVYILAARRHPAAAPADPRAGVKEIVP